MFTGLIEAVGAVTAMTGIAGGTRLEIATPLAFGLSRGESVATNGVCLTVVESGDRRVAMEVSPETLRASALGRLTVGEAVNLERSLRADARVGGHFVLGHVDATGTIRAVRPEGEFQRITVAFPPAMTALLIPKGSVAVDGISLTVASLEPDAFDVQIVPHTWAHTNLHVRRPGDVVNLEGDVLGKYVVRVAELMLREPSART